MSTNSGSTGITPTTSNATSVATAKTSKTLGEADFLKLLTTQLKYQDPMKPMEDTSFIAQMAQFSGLQAQTTLNKTLTDGQNFSQLTEASALIGKIVNIKSIKSVNGADQVVNATGTVEQVTRDKDGVKVQVNGALYGMGDIFEVKN